MNWGLILNQPCPGAALVGGGGTDWDVVWFREAFQNAWPANGKFPNAP
jgi:hypothetical protein